jgi:anti-sigma B factor antagonist
MSGSDEAALVDSNGVVIVGGDIDVVSASSIDLAVRQAEQRLGDSMQPVIIDVAQVRFIDSSGLRILLATSRRNERVGRRVVLRAPGTSVDRLLGITGTAGMFELEYDAGSSAAG